MTTHGIAWRLRRPNYVLMALILAATAVTGSWAARGQDPPPSPAPVAAEAAPQGALAGDQDDPQAPRCAARRFIHEDLRRRWFTTRRRGR